MKISCPACSAKYSIADEKIKGRLAKIRCRKCSATVVVDGKVDPPAIHVADETGGLGAAAGSDDASGSAGAAGAQYTVDFGGAGQRTMRLQEIVAAYHAGQVTAETYIWEESMADWAPLAGVAEIARALQASVRPPPGDLVATANLRSPAQESYSAERAVGQIPALGTATDQPVQRAAVMEPLSQGTDLFGRIATAGSEEDVTIGMVEPAPRPLHAVTGARNESSVLFSLNALTTGTAQAPKVTRAEDDSGLIDLGALTAKAGPAGYQDSGSTPLAVAPLGFGPAPAMIGAGLGNGGASRNSKGALWIGGISVTAVAAVVVAYLLGSSSGSATDGVAAGPGAQTGGAPATMAATPAPTEAKPAAPEGQKQLALEDDTSKGGAKAGSETSTSKTSSKPRTRPARAKPAADAEAAAAKPADEGAAEAPAPKPPVKKTPPKVCNCKPGDLLCAIRCRSSG